VGYMSSSGDIGHSQFFLVRLWSDPAGDGKVEWHGRLQHVLSGEAHAFHDWPTLIDLFLAMLQGTQNGRNDVAANIVPSPGGGDKEPAD
jgi:hypothetical protein